MNRRSFFARAAGVISLPWIAKIPSSAYAESDVAPLVIPPPETFDLFSKGRVIDIGFKNAIKGYEHIYPTLAKSIQRMEMGFQTEIRWSRNINGTSLHHNFMQITRTPFGISNTERSSRDYSDARLMKLRKEQLHQHLFDVENTLRNGNPSERWRGYVEERASVKPMAKYPTYKAINSVPIRTCGGVRAYPPGVPCLVVLRDLSLLTGRQPNDADMYQEEFLSEFTLRVDAR